MLDIEEEVIVYLSEMVNYPIYAEVPNPRPEAFITVERTGGESFEQFIDHPVVAVQSWANTRFEASVLAQDVDALLLDMPQEVENVMGCERESLYNFPDPDSEQSRYQGVYDLVTQ